MTKLEFSPRWIYVIAEFEFWIAEINFKLNSECEINKCVRYKCQHSDTVMQGYCVKLSYQSHILLCTCWLRMIRATDFYVLSLPSFLTELPRENTCNLILWCINKFRTFLYSCCRLLIWTNELWYSNKFGIEIPHEKSLNLIWTY